MRSELLDALGRVYTEPVYSDWAQNKVVSDPSARRDTRKCSQTSLQPGFSLPGLPDGSLLSHSDVGVQVFGLSDAIQALPAQLGGGDLALTERRRHLGDRTAGM